MLELLVLASVWCVVVDVLVVVGGVAAVVVIDLDVAISIIGCVL